jgi:hypothetical protein
MRDSVIIENCAGAGKNRPVAPHFFPFVDAEFPFFTAYGAT